MIAYPRTFPGQFIIGRDGTIPTAHIATQHRLNDLAIGLVDDLPVTRVEDAAGRLIGALLGHPVDYRAGVVRRDVLKLAEPHPGSAGLEDYLERHIYGLGGSFVFVLDDGEARRVYLDACGSLSAVFDPSRGLCAATAGLLLSESEYRERFRTKLYEHLRVIDDGWFPAGLTAHEGISRLICNHYLDCDTGTQHRHWPRTAITPAENPDAACATINGVVLDTMKALQAAGSVATTLTAGNETRLVLGACREIKDSLELYTLTGLDDLRLDSVRAAELVRRFGLNHKFLQLRFADSDGSEQWHARCGHCIGGSNMRTFPTIEALRHYDYFTGGLGGEIGRAFFWRPTDTDRTEIDAPGICARFGMPVHEEVVDAVAQWLTTVPDVDSYLKLDLAYLELRMSCWGFALSYATSDVFQIHPLISRESFVAMMSLPPEWRRTNRMITRCIELSWPELLALPINRYGDLRDLGRPLMRAVRNPRLVLRKLRKRFG